MVQTIGSAGESLAGGVIFTIPVLFLWADEGRTASPELLSIALIALCGGILGVLFMIPLRNSLIVKEHRVLPYPEGTACAEGVMDGNLPWSLVFIGLFLALTVEILQIPVLPVAIGLYLPFELSATIMLGGAVRFLADKGLFGKRNRDSSSGILFCSGMIAGEGIIGILLAVLAVTGAEAKLDLSGSMSSGPIGGLVLLAILLISVFLSGTKAKD